MTTDYSILIDEETWAFIERTNSFYPPDAIDLSIAQQREVYDTMCRAFFAGYPEAVSSADRFIDAAIAKSPFASTKNVTAIRKPSASIFMAAALSLAGSKATTMSAPNCAMAQAFA